MADNIKHYSQFGEKSGRVYVSFMISETGMISDITVIKGINDYYDNEAIRIIKLMPTGFREE
jgi:outer membrane biosynthesis protein TonB